MTPSSSRKPPQNQADRGEATKPAETILKQEIQVGEAQLSRSSRGLFLSGLSAGLDIGVGPLLVVAILAGVGEVDLTSRAWMSFAYSLGFVIVILGRSELFTEHTTLAILPLLSGKATLARVARLWGIVYASNVLGAVLFALFAGPLGLSLGLFEPAHVNAMATHLTDVTAWVMVGSAIGAGWLMGLVSWLVTAARDTVGQIIVIVFVTGSIAFLGLHHSIAGSIEVLLGVFSGGVAFTAWLRFLALSTLGNAIGGTVLVALLKFGHVVEGAEGGRRR